jgi:hypothetical protein
MIDAVAAAEAYVTRRCGPAGEQADSERIAWQDGDLFDAFLAGCVWAAGVSVLPSYIPAPASESAAGSAACVA